MKGGPLVVLVPVLALAACRSRGPAASAPKAFGFALVEVSGGKQVATTGSPLDQPLVVQVNDAQGSPVVGALVSFRAGGGAMLDPAAGLTGSDGQLSTTVRVGGVAGRYQVVATTRNRSGKPADLRIDEIAVSYQQNLGRQVSDVYCLRCHDPESTAERVSNHDDLKATAHAFTDGAFLNTISDADLAAIITHGGPALSKSAEMPPYGATLDKADIDALTAYIRAVADPPFRSKGLTYASR